MKAYEGLETDRRLDGSRPVVARIDGRSFSRFTRDLARPFDIRLVRAMQETTIALVRDFNARIGYTQSDEISLVFAAEDENGNAGLPFDGKVFKLTSTLAAFATSAFMAALVRNGLSHKTAALPHFDARVFNVPDESEATNALVWRVKDASRNAINMAARSHYPQKALHGVSTAGMLEMMQKDGHDLMLPGFFHYGSFVRRSTVTEALGEDERLAIPEAHRPCADERFVRHRVGVVEALFDRPFLAIENRVGFVFHGEEPRFRDGA